MTSLHVVEQVQSLEEPHNKTTVLSWSLPCRPNGKIDKFLIICSGVESNQVFTYEVAVIDSRDEYVLGTEDFMPDSRFNISIRAVSQNILGKEFSIYILIDAGGKIQQNIFKFIIFSIKYFSS